MTDNIASALFTLDELQYIVDYARDKPSSNLDVILTSLAMDRYYALDFLNIDSNFLDQIKNDCESLDKGPWSVVKKGSWMDTDYFWVKNGHGITNIRCYAKEEAEFIANCRKNIPILLSYIDSLAVNDCFENRAKKAEAECRRLKASILQNVRRKRRTLSRKKPDQTEIGELHQKATNKQTDAKSFFTGVSAPMSRRQEIESWFSQPKPETYKDSPEMEME